MRKGVLLIILTVLITSCDNDLDIVADRENLSVLYGVLDPQSDSNFIRVQRGYLSDDPASASFNNPDSLYYDTNNINVFIRQYDGLGNDATQENERRLIYDNSIPLKPGTFTTEDYYLFRVPSNYTLDNSKYYEVAILREDGTEAAARTGLVGDLVIKEPRQTFAFRFFNGVIRFEVPAGRGGTALIGAYQILIRFNYRDLDRTTLDTTFRTVTLEPPLLPGGSEGSLTYTSGDFFRAIAGQIEPDDNVLRFFIDMEVEVWAGAEELVTYYRLNEPSSGINQNRPTFEQVTNGTGILTSRSSALRQNIRLERSRFQQDLFYSSPTCGLNFVELSGVGATDTCFCIDGDKVCL
jgi:hypothetical protein